MIYSTVPVPPAPINTKRESSSDASGPEDLAELSAAEASGFFFVLERIFNKSNHVVSK